MVKMMLFCRECGAQLVPGSKFCANCGTAVAVHQEPKPQPSGWMSEAAAPVEPTVSAIPVLPAVPAVAQAPVVPVKAKVFGFVGMGLAIEAIGMVLLSVLFVWAGVGLEDGELLGSAFGYGLVSLASAIVGLVLSVKSRSRGFKNAVTTIGIALGIASIVALIAGIVFAIFGVALTASYGNYI